MPVLRYTSLTSSLFFLWFFHLLLSLFTSRVIALHSSLISACMVSVFLSFSSSYILASDSLSATLFCFSGLPSAHRRQEADKGKNLSPRILSLFDLSEQ